MRRQQDEGSELASGLLPIVVVIMVVLWVMGTAGSCATELGGIL